MRVHQVHGIWSNLTCISTNHFDLCNQTTHLNLVADSRESQQTAQKSFVT
jgi:hypothetical protein